MSARRSPAGFSILELTIAIAIMLLLAALAAPPLLRWQADSMFRESSSQIVAVMERARADAQRRGVSVQVCAERRPHGTWVVTEKPLESESSVAGLDGSAIAATPSSQPPVPGASEDREPGRKTLLVIGRAIELAFNPESASAAGEAPATTGSLLSQSKQSGTPQNELGESSAGGGVLTIELAVFFPDGSAGSLGQVVLRDRHGRSADLRVIEWTGAIQISAMSYNLPQGGTGPGFSEPSASAPARTSPAARRGGVP